MTGRVRETNVSRVVIITALILLVPLVAMQLSDEVDWTGSDFVVAGTLLLGAGVSYELLARRSPSVAFRLACAIALATGLFLIWANLAVGLIGTEDNPANWMYVGVLAVGITGVALARLRPDGMARALTATALAQVLVAVVALAAGMQEAERSASEIVGVTALFVVPWLVSALLFRRAAA